MKYLSQLVTQKNVVNLRDHFWNKGTEMNFSVDISPLDTLAYLVLLERGLTFSS